jgi:hypothetical protein
LAKTVAAEPTPEPTPRDKRPADSWAIGCNAFVDVNDRN